MISSRRWLVLVVSLFAAPAGATTYVVDVGGGFDYTAIGPAIAAAADGDTILVHPGTYTGAPNRDIYLAAKNLVIESSATWYETIIDCEGLGRAMFINGAAVDSTTVVRGFTFTRGWARASTEDGAGAILCHLGTPIIEDCYFVQNEGNYAGAVKLLYGDATIRFCAFVGNEAEYAGALHTAYCSPTVARCTFAGNTATGSGGAFRAFAGGPALRNCTFARNSCSSGGGCLEFTGAGVAGELDRCIVAFGPQGHSVVGSGVTTEHCIVFANAGGDSLPGTHHSNAFVDPLFCGMDAGDLTLCANSPALPVYNPWSLSVGHLGQGCSDCASAATPTSWGAIKALFAE
jgi:predicted outer membrane repeat protein